MFEINQLRYYRRLRSCYVSLKLCFVYNKATSIRHQQRLDLIPYLVAILELRRELGRVSNLNYSSKRSC